MAIEDAAALGLVFNKQNFNGNIREALEVYERVRKPRATKVQAASARARENIHERIGKNDRTQLMEDPELTVEKVSPIMLTTLGTRSSMRRTS